ncbi:hypothetical protein ASG37_02835 [Sphingomonas sp. Leaf407]|uniref:hypothetical protein n=1 Tax=unclassified Sphingomonas TaxID=196159 RepID=UPI0006F76A57|nr:MULTISPECIES: hypothetical protein [unclassified Sphingomonas]KQN40737.1 hypothetical protein ASE97_02860 [Sphingomonas sp. Leaf42]KQT30092.1 hypothetical protein ASG37_02835 [Sphingomonas sp. Leaf407]
MNRLFRLALIFVVLAVAGFAAVRLFVDHRPAAPAPAASPTPKPSPGGLTLAAAQRSAFPDGMEARTPEGSRMVYADGQLVDTPFGPVLVNPGTIPDAAHAEGGAIAIHYLRQDTGGIHVTRALPFAVRSGSSGSISEWSVSRTIGDLPVVYTEGGGTWQGYSCSFATLTELRPAGPAELTTIQVMASDDGAVPSEQSKTTVGKIVDVVPNRSFVVRFTGARNFDAHYVRRGERYVPEGGERDTLGGC